jgi:hypothetical protein
MGEITRDDPLLHPNARVRHAEADKDVRAEIREESALVSPPLWRKQAPDVPGPWRGKCVDLREPL